MPYYDKRNQIISDDCSAVNPEKISSGANGHLL